MSDPQQQPHVVAVVGSPRRQGNVAALVGATLEELERHGCRCTTLMLAELRIDACDGHRNCGELAECPHDDDMAGVLEAVYGADGLILASPVYWENVSSQMKAFMDRAATRYYHEQWLAPKVVGLIAVAAETGLDDTLSAMGRFVSLASGDELPTLRLSGLADSPGVAAADTALMAEARDLGRAMAARLGREQVESPA